MTERKKKKPEPGAPAETEPQRQERMKKAWDKLATVSRTVQQFESDYARTMAKIPM